MLEHRAVAPEAAPEARRRGAGLQNIPIFNRPFPERPTSDARPPIACRAVKSLSTHQASTSRITAPTIGPRGTPAATTSSPASGRVGRLPASGQGQKRAPLDGRAPAAPTPAQASVTRSQNASTPRCARPAWRTCRGLIHETSGGSVPRARDEAVALGVGQPQALGQRPRRPPDRPAAGPPGAAAASSVNSCSVSIATSASNRARPAGLRQDQRPGRRSRPSAAPPARGSSARQQGQQLLGDALGGKARRRASRSASHAASAAASGSPRPYQARKRKKRRMRRASSRMRVCRVADEDDRARPRRRPGPRRWDRRSGRRASA